MRVLSALLLAAVAAGHGILPPPSLTAASGSPSVIWTDAMAIGVGGRPFESNSGNATYARFPPAAQADLNSGEWSWGQCSTGMFVQFASNATAVHVRYTLASGNKTVFSNFSPLGFSGVDLYARVQQADPWRWVASAFNGLNGGSAEVVESPLWANASGWPTPPAPAQASQQQTSFYRLHFPSYNGVLSMEIGVPVGASLTADLSWNASKAALYLGTSITQGGLTARPGQIYTSRLTRALGTVVKNLGLCGSCRLELGLAKWVALSGAPSTLVIDCTANMDAAGVANNTVPFVRALRAAAGGWEAVPIVLVEPITYMPAWIQGQDLGRAALRAALSAAFEELVAGGDEHVHYVKTAQLEAQMEALEQITYEGVHPLDRGHALIAEALTGVLAPLVAAGQGGVGGAVSWQREVPRAAPLPAVQLDAIQTRTDPPADTVWVDAVEGKLDISSPFADSPSPYNRLPAGAKGLVRDAVWGLSLDSAGITVAFATDSPTLSIDMTCRDAFEPMPHFAVTGVSGVELWAWDEQAGRYRFAAPGNNLYGVNRLVAQLWENGNATSVGGKMLRWVAVLPTYNEVVSFKVGVAPGARIVGDAPFVVGEKKAPIVWYGTSILQGGVSFKSGEIETWRVARALNRPVLNFGFSGNGKMETAVGGFLAGIPAPAAFIVDCNWNMDAGSIAAAAVPLVKFLRASNVSAPIYLSEGLPFGRNWAVPEDELEQAKANAALRAAYEELSKGDAALGYMSTGQLFGEASVEDTATAAGLHATDAGMHDMASAWVGALGGLA